MTSGIVWPVDELRINELGPGWEAAEAALRAVQADLSRAVSGAPQLVLLWYDDDAGCRMAYVGKGRDWYYGADGPWELERDYATALASIAEKVQDAIADTLLGYYAYWPYCPDHGYPLHVPGIGVAATSWACARDDDHVVAEVGQLPHAERALGSPSDKQR